MNASPTHAPDSHLQQDSFTAEDQDGHSGQPSSASVAEEDDELPIHVPDYPTCPWKQVLEDETQVDEWVAARALEFAFTKHGERKPKKTVQEKDESGRSTCSQSKTRSDCGFTVPTSSHPQATMIVLIDSSPVKPLERTKEHNDETRQAANTLRAPLSPTMDGTESLAGSREPHTAHIPTSAVEQHDPPSPLQIRGRGIVSKPKTQVVDSADESNATCRRGASQYDSIVEYRCCWSGTYRPRMYENKTGQKRQRAPSTKVSVYKGTVACCSCGVGKVGCKARFVIRKVSNTGQFNVTYHCMCHTLSWMRKFPF